MRLRVFRRSEARLRLFVEADGKGPCRKVSRNPALAFGISATILAIVSGAAATNGSSTRLRRSSLKSHVPCLEYGAITKAHSSSSPSPGR